MILMITSMALAHRYITFPYPETSWCDTPSQHEDPTNYKLCRPLPVMIHAPPAQARPPPGQNTVPSFLIHFRVFLCLSKRNVVKGSTSCNGRIGSRPGLSTSNDTKRVIFFALQPAFAVQHIETSVFLFLTCRSWLPRISRTQGEGETANWSACHRLPKRHSRYSTQLQKRQR